MTDPHALARACSSSVDLAAGGMAKVSAERTVKLSSMGAFFADQDAVDRVLAQEGDRVLYEVAVMEPEDAGPDALAFGTTRLNPGTVGAEYHMTKGHFHTEAGAPEVYLCTSGRGGLILMTAEGESEFYELTPGRVCYVPGACAHRMVNTGTEPLVTFAVYPVDAGHDYGSIERRGFPTLVVEREGAPRVVRNERWS